MNDITEWPQMDGVEVIREGDFADGHSLVHVRFTVHSTFYTDASLKIIDRS